MQSFLYVVIILDVLSEYQFDLFQFTDLFSLNPKFSWTTVICSCMCVPEWFPKSFLLIQMAWVIPLCNSTWSPAGMLNNNLVAGWKTFSSSSVTGLQKKTFLVAARRVFVFSCRALSLKTAGFFTSIHSVGCCCRFSGLVMPGSGSSGPVHRARDSVLLCVWAAVVCNLAS